MKGCAKLIRRIRMLGLLTRSVRHEQVDYSAFERFLTWRRFRAATPFIGFESRVCDVGFGPRAPFLHSIESRLLSGVGLDENPGELTQGKISALRTNITSPLAFGKRTVQSCDDARRTRTPRCAPKCPG